MQLGIIVLPSNTEEMDKVLAALGKLNLSGTVQPAAKATPTKTEKAAPTKPAAKKETLKVPTGPELVAQMTKVRDELGEDTVAEILTAFGATKLKELDKDDWASVFAAATVALEGAGGDDDLGGDDDDDLDLDGGDDDDDLDGDDDEGEELDAEDVKTACQAHATKHGKAKTQAILAKHGLNTVRGLKSADNKTLTAILKAVS